MPTEITDSDFIHSFLKAAKARKLSVVVVYGERVGTRANLKLTSNVGPDMTSAVLQWLRKSTPPEVSPPPDETPPTPAAA